MTSGAPFQPSARLRKPAEFKQVFAEGQRVKRQSVATGRSEGTFLDAAAAVLRRTRAPLTSGDITARAIELKLLSDSIGKTPERTMAAALYLDVSRSAAPRFVRLSKAGPIRASRNSVK